MLKVNICYLFDNYLYILLGNSFKLTPTITGAYGNKASPNRIRSPKKTIRITRDTLNGRLRKRIGKPGSRKYHRWENGEFYFVFFFL